MDKTISLGLVIGAALGKDYFSTFDKAEQKVTRLGSALKADLGRQKTIERFGALKKSVSATESEMQAAQKRVATLAREIKGVENPTKAMIRDFDKAKRSAAMLKDKHVRQKEELHRLRGELGRAGIDTRNLSAANIRLGKSIDDTRRKVERLNKAQAGQQAAAERLVAMRGKMIGAVGAIYAASRVVGHGMETSMQMETLGVQANESAASMKALHRELVDTASDKNIRLNPDKITAAIGEIVEKTGDLKFARENIRNIGLTIRATGADGQAIGGIMAEFEKMGSFKSPKEVLAAIDTLATQGKEGAFTLRNLAQLGPRVVTAYTSAVKGARDGATVMREMGAALQIVRMGTGSSEQAATAFESLLADLQDSTKLEQLSNLGIEVFDPEALANGEEKLRPITDLMKEIMDATGGNKSVLGAIFGRESIRAFNGFDEKKLAHFMQINGDGSTVTEDAARLAEQGDAQWESLTASLTRVGDAFSMSLLPAVNAVLEPVADLATWTGRLLEDYPALGRILGGVSVGFMVYATAVGALVAAKWALNTVILKNYLAMLKTSAQLLWAGSLWTANAARIGLMTVAQWAWNVAMSANPIGAVIVGVAALAAGAVWVYKNWDKVTAWFGAKLDWLAEKFSWVGDAWRSIFGGEDAGGTPAKSAPRRGIGAAVNGKTPAPVAAAIAGAMTVTAAGAAPAPAAAAPSHVSTSNSYQIAIQQQPGQNGADLVDEMQREIRKREAAAGRAAMHDGADL